MVMFCMHAEPYMLAALHIGSGDGVLRMNVLRQTTSHSRRHRSSSSSSSQQCSELRHSTRACDAAIARFTPLSLDTSQINV